MSTIQNAINANATTPLVVTNGGTGVDTFTTDGILYGNGSGAVQATAALTNGQLLIGSTGTAPNPATLTAGSNVTITNAAGSITIASNAVNTANPNLIIGGDFGTNPWQRGTSFAGLGSGASSYTADRFQYEENGTGVVTVSQSSTVPTVTQANYLSQNSLEIAVTTAQSTIAAGNYSVLSYKVEGYDFVNIAQQAFTLSFWVNSSLTGTYCVAFTNSGFDHTYVATYTISSANTWQHVVINVSASPSAGTWNYTNGTGLQILFTLAVGSTFQTTAGSWQSGGFIGTSAQTNFLNSTSNVIYFDLVKLEIGSTATQFVGRSIETELALCQRYFEKSYAQGTSPGTATIANYSYLGFAINSTFFYGGTNQTFLVEKRASPSTLTIYSPNSGAAGNFYNLTGAVDVAGTASPGTKNILYFSSTGATLTANDQYAVHWTANSEL